MSARFAVFDTPVGRCALIWTADGIAGLQLPEKSDSATRTRIAQCFPDATEVPLPGDQLVVVDRIRALLAGGRDDLADITVDLTAVGEFDRSVYAVTRTITPGHTLTYGEVAARIGAPNGAQAVGQALGRNPIPVIVPCHRVLGADGAVGGFSAAGGVTAKEALLAAEGVPGFGEPTLF